jgi:hypothetical protein
MLNLAIDIVETVAEAEKLRKPLDVREHAARLARRHSGEQVTRSDIAVAIRQETDHSAASILKLAPRGDKPIDRLDLRERWPREAGEHRQTQPESAARATSGNTPRP